eukprot:TRINITY_DN1509_c0_g1_i1.p1 TRINITY_DN1509_c0_g1~~TRINITY_DN1509_c0_g1_i1.p1  ORF type:complete len:373 (+),score=52.56 TRINITY_DN1509_c0_g1_i1:71-1120(+)
MSSTSNQRLEWIPASIFSPLFLTKINVDQPPPGKPLDRSVWDIRKSSDGEWATIIGNRGFTRNIHYWEFRIVNFQNHLMFGVVAPPDDSYFNVINLWSHLGNTSKELLSKYSIGYYLQPTLWNYAQGANRGDQIDLGTTAYDGSRIGLLLDLSRFELTLFFFTSSNNTNKPDKQILLATLEEGVKYYPAFSFYHTATAIELHTNAALPSTVKDYVEEVRDSFYYMRLISAFTGQVAEMDPSTNKVVTAISRSTNNRNQLWKWRGQSLINVGTGLALALEPQTENIVELIGANYDGSDSQIWVINLPSVLNPKTNRAVDVAEGSTAVGTRIIGYPFHGKSNQQWSVEYVL